ncbi:MAG: hypothetical protein KBT00_08370 [Bacteroidales bacterium]|nr:hypothetical protein [Candidatus Cacconaster merdequi]
MNINFPTRRTNPLIEHFRTHAINQHKPDSMKLGNYDSDYDDDDENSSYDPEEDLEMMFDDEDLEEMHESY